MRLFHRLSLAIFFLLLCSNADAESLTGEWITIPNRPECAFRNTLSSSFEEAKWDGICEGGYIQGQGTLTYVNRHYPSTLLGSFTKGELNGEGELVYWYLKSDGYREMIYQGSFKHSRMHGYGVLHLSQLGVFKGQFKNGFVDGPGVLEISDIAKYSGSFQGAPRSFDVIGKGVLEKFGNQTYRYEGTFNGLIKEGTGLLKLPSGSKYEGSFHNDQYHGLGKFILADGDECEGEWVSGRMVGIGRGIKDGTRTQCAMDENGMFVFAPVN